ARARAQGDEARSVIAGYHWFTDWGRDTMISLEGLTLCTGRHPDAGYILRTFAQHIKDGLIPNLFPEKGQEGLYHTADATLWYFHALQRYVEATADRGTLRGLLPKLKDVVEHHLRGTRFGIHVDHDDGLLWQGAEGYQLTWMDAKVGDWVVTLRPNQVVAISLDHPVLDPSRWNPVLQVVRDKLLTPVGLRSLGPDHPDYKPRYFGDLRSRDAAYHQGTVWAWLIGPFVDAWLRAYPQDRRGAGQFLSKFPQHVSEACVGSISEVFDA